MRFLIIQRNLFVYELLFIIMHCVVSSYYGPPQWFLPFFSCWLETLCCSDFSFHFPKYEDLLQDSFKWNSIWHDAEWWPHCALKNGTSRILRGTIRHSFGHSSSSSVLSKTMISCVEKKYFWVLFLQMIIRRRRGIVAPGPLAIGSPRDVARLKGMLLIRYCHPENQWCNQKTKQISEDFLQQWQRVDFGPDSSGHRCQYNPPWPANKVSHDEIR